MGSRKHHFDAAAAISNLSFHGTLRDEIAQRR